MPACACRAARRCQPEEARRSAARRSGRQHRPVLRRLRQLRRGRGCGDPLPLLLPRRRRPQSVGMGTAPRRLARPRHRLAAIAPRRPPPDLRGRMTIHDLPARAPDARLDGVIKLAVMAVGGQGGGVLTNWIEDLARAQRLCRAGHLGCRRVAAHRGHDLLYRDVPGVGSRAGLLADARGGRCRHPDRRRDDGGRPRHPARLRDARPDGADRLDPPRAGGVGKIGAGRRHGQHRRGAGGRRDRRAPASGGRFRPGGDRNQARSSRPACSARWPHPARCPSRARRSRPRSAPAARVSKARSAPLPPGSRRPCRPARPRARARLHRRQGPGWPRPPCWRNGPR